MNIVNQHLKNKTIVITGCTDGIGYQAALTYAEQGANLILVARNETKLLNLKNNILHNNPNLTIHYIVFDFNSSEKNNYLLLRDKIQQVTPYIDGLLHSAGMLGEMTSIANYDEMIWHDVMQVNINSQFILTKTLLPLLLLSQHGAIIFTSSGVGRSGRADWGAYSVSKFATEGLMQVLADEYKQTTLRVNCINPGATRSKMRAKAFPKEDPQTLKTPEDIIPLYVYLMSDLSIGITGQSIDAQKR